MVEPIDDIEFKTAAAIVIGVPIIIPLNVTWYTEPSQQALFRGISRALGLDSGRRTLLALAAKQYGYPANMQKHIALATDNTNWAVNMSSFIYTTAKRAAGWDFNVLPSLVLAAANLSDVQILAAHATAYIWNPAGVSLVQRGEDGLIAGQSEAQRLSESSHKVKRAMELAKQSAFSGDYSHVPARTSAPARKPAAKKKATAKKAAAKKSAKKKSTAGKSSGKIKGRATSAKKKKKKKKKAGGKKKTGGKKKGSKKKKKSTRRALGGASSTMKKRKSKKAGGKKKTKKSKAKPKAKKSRKGKKAKQPRYRGGAAGYPMDRRIGRQIPMLGLTRSAKDSALGSLGGRTASSQTAKQIMQQALARARGGKRFS
jgi:hypothetical protein